MCLSLHSFFFNLFILFIYFWLCWVFVAAHGLSLVAVSGDYSSLRYTGLSLRWLLLLQSMGFSSCGSRALEHRLSSCGALVQLLRGMWDLPTPGLEPVSPALAGRFLTTVPPGKPKLLFLKYTYTHTHTTSQSHNLTILFSYCPFQPELELSVS